MRGFRSTLVLLAVLFGLLGYIYFYEMKRPDPTGQTEQKQKVFTVEPDKIEEVRVQSSSGERTTLKKVDSVWNIVEPMQTKADEAEMTGIVTNLASLEVQRIVDEAPADIAQYGLATPHAEIGFKKAGQADVTRLLVGDKTATGGELYAKLPNEKRVFLISVFLDTTFNRGTFDLRDKTVLKFQRDKVDLVEVVSKDGKLAFAKSGDQWKISSPIAARADLTPVEGLVGRLQTLQMKSIAAQDAAAKDLATYGLDKPAYTATVGAASARATLEIGKADPAGALYARDLARPATVVTIEASLADDVKKAADDYRPKEIFEFRSFSATRIEITRGASSSAFERVTAKDGTTKWQKLNPAKDVAQADIDALLAATSSLMVEKYVDAKTKTGIDAPAAVVLARFDDGKKEERVTFGKVGADVFAVRTGEPGAAKVDGAKFDEAMKALDTIK
jgi:hypothetical protein